MTRLRAQLVIRSEVCEWMCLKEGWEGRWTCKIIAGYFSGAVLIDRWIWALRR